MAKLLLKHNAPINAQTVVCNDYVLMQGKNPVPKFCFEEGEPRLDNNLCLGDFVQTQKNICIFLKNTRKSKILQPCLQSLI